MDPPCPRQGIGESESGSAHAWPVASPSSCSAFHSVAEVMGEELRPPASDDDWAAYHAIRRHVLFELRGIGANYDANHPDEHRAGHHPFLFCDADEPIGTIRVDVSDGVATFRLVAIRADLQRRGHGGRLLEAAEAFARRQACSRIESHVFPGAVGFYERCGFARADAADGKTFLMMKSIANAESR